MHSLRTHDYRSTLQLTNIEGVGSRELMVETNQDADPNYSCQSQSSYLNRMLNHYYDWNQMQAAGPWDCSIVITTAPSGWLDKVRWNCLDVDWLIYTRCRTFLDTFVG